MPIPNRYQISGEGAIATYDAFDLNNITGHKRFYLCGTTQGGATTFVLTPLTAKSYPTQNSTPNGTDLDFDVTFNVPQIINGDCIISTAMENATASTIFWTYTIYKVAVGGAETSLGSTTGVTCSGIASIRDCVKINISNAVIAIGEKIRLNCIATTGAGAHYFYTDPSNSMQTASNDMLTGAFKNDTDSFIDLSFKIDL